MANLQKCADGKFECAGNILPAGNKVSSLAGIHVELTSDICQ